MDNGRTGGFVGWPNGPRLRLLATTLAEIGGGGGGAAAAAVV